MNKIGIIFAMYEELEEMLKLVKLNKINKIYDLDFYECTINDKECILVESGVGKVNASRSTQVLIDNYSPNYILNVGVAGGIDDRLNVCDIVVSDKLVQYDFDITAFNHDMGYIPNTGVYISSDRNMLKYIKNNYDVKIGNIASADRFVTNEEISKKLYHDFNAYAVEMEGASIAQVCYLCNKPFIVIRCISDIPGDNNKMNYEEFLESSSDKVSKLLYDVLTNY